MENLISANRIQDKVDPFYKILFEKEVTSTNDVLCEMALKGASEGTVLLAEHQTAGKGRKGRSFYSPGEKGIYMSILLRPEVSPEVAVKLTPMAAVAVSEAIETVAGVKNEIKWVNDILINGKKVCGILTESSYSAVHQQFDYVIVGIGINLFSPNNGYPDDIKDIAVALSDASDTELDINQIVSEVLNSILKYYFRLPEITFFDAYKKRMSLLGKQVNVISFGHTEKCVAEGLTEDFHLVVRNEKGDIKELDSGEISIIL